MCLLGLSFMFIIMHLLKSAYSLLMNNDIVIIIFMLLFLHGNLHLLFLAFAWILFPLPLLSFLVMYCMHFIFLEEQKKFFWRLIYLLVTEFIDLLVSYFISQIILFIYLFIFTLFLCFILLVEVKEEENIYLYNYIVVIGIFCLFVCLSKVFRFDLSCRI